MGKIKAFLNVSVNITFRFNLTLNIEFFGKQRTPKCYIKSGAQSTGFYFNRGNSPSGSLEGLYFSICGYTDEGLEGHTSVTVLTFGDNTFRNDTFFLK